MGLYIIAERFQKEWSVWNIRIVITLSLCIQILLIILSPLRKRSRSGLLNAIIWLCYIMADWIAIYSIGIIVKNKADARLCMDSKCVVPDLSAFWAPFLLLHLGGPDTITSFSLEDNELWLRHILNLMVEVVVVLYILLLAIPSNGLWLPLLFIFVAGTIKYCERTYALYHACLGHIKATTAPTREDLSEAFGRRGPIWLRRAKESVKVRDGYYLYKISRKLIPNLLLTHSEFTLSRSLFQDLSDPIYAFDVVAKELSFIYDELFTKMARLRSGFSLFLRFTCIVLTVAAFVMFPRTASYKKLKVSHSIDIYFTYVLLGFAALLEILALLMLVFSNWGMAFLQDFRFSCCNSCWSEKFSQHNFISYCMKISRRSRAEKCFHAIIDSFGLTSTFNESWYCDDKKVSEGLKTFIYNWLKDLHDKIETNGRKDLMSSRGQRTLEKVDNSELFSSCVKFDYETSLFMWHIATDLFYNAEAENQRGDSGNENRGGEGDREICKILSDYMFYLYIMRPSLISTHKGGIFQTRFDKTCKSARDAIESLDKTCKSARDAIESLESTESEVAESEEQGNDAEIEVERTGAEIGEQRNGAEIEEQRNVIDIPESSEQRKVIDIPESSKQRNVIDIPESSEQRNVMDIPESSEKRNVCQKLLSKYAGEILNAPDDDHGFVGDSAFRLRTIADSGSDLVMRNACVLAAHLLRESSVDLWKLMSEVWMEMLCYGAYRSRGDAHAQQLTKGGELITFVWVLMAHFGFTDCYVASARTGIKGLF